MKILRWMDENIESVLMIVLSLLTVTVIFIQVFMRYVMGASLVWSEELARYAFIWLIFIGVSYGVKRQAHISVDALSMILNKKGNIVMGIVANLFFLAFAALLAYYSFNVAIQVTRLSPALEIPLIWVYLAPAVGFALTSIRLVQRLIMQIQALNMKESR